MDYKLLGKNIAEYLLRVFCFLITVKFWFIELSVPVILALFPILIVDAQVTVYLREKNIVQYNELDDPVFEIYLVAFFTLYFLAKIFGIFKKLDKLNILASLIIISFISYLLILVGKINFLVDELTYKEGLEYSYTMYLLIPAFLLYKFFGFLAKKFPFPFAKIGYYTSIEFPKDLYLKIRNNIKNNNEK